MNTLSLVLLAVPISAAIGFALGTLGHRHRRFRGILHTSLDLMQTVPAFAYLIPLLLLFGFGPVVGLIASALYAVPPMVRNTMLGLELVPPNVREAGLMSGCTPRQQFWHVEVPTALPQLLIGLNQTTMAALSMVIVAAIIGGFQDIGWEVLSSMRKAEFGQSVLSGLVIALLAILIDRLTLGFARGRPGGPTRSMEWMTARRLASVLAIALGIAVLLRVVPQSSLVPASANWLQVSAINELLLGFVRDHAGVFSAIRNGALYGLILPLRIGISGAATAAIWGFDLPLAGSIAYVVAVSAAVAFITSRFGWRPAMAFGVAATFLYVGFLNFPWPAFIVLVALLAVQVSGWKLAVFATAGLAAILLSGFWVPLMQSLYLCALAVVLCLVLGGALGIWAAHDDRISGLLRPINDALQTMPQFVFLIPALMLFKVGEFTALIAVMLYAIVPPIRYVEHGIRTVPTDVVEAVRQMGSMPGQLLWQAKLPLALPVVMLGVNQTIMAALSMLAIAAMVGTRDLGQQVYVALGKADAGMGLIAGLSIAFIAITSDRITQAWLSRRPGALPSSR
jgi:glycine betaine/proline transport system permease protein